MCNAFLTGEKCILCMETKINQKSSVGEDDKATHLLSYIFFPLLPFWTTQFPLYSPLIGMFSLIFLFLKPHTT